jgi:hypothetical protein
VRSGFTLREPLKKAYKLLSTFVSSISREFQQMHFNTFAVVAPADRQSSASRPEQQQKVPWLLAAIVFLIEFVLTVHREAFNVPGPDPYWAFHWTRDYSQGFVRRGLLGAILLWLHLDNTNYLLILTLSWAISFILFLLLTKAAWQLSAGLSRDERLAFTTVLLLSPLTVGILIETTGDPLQLILLVYLFLLRLVIETTKPALAAGALFLAFGATTELIHEASLFFLAPALVVAAFILWKNGTARAALLGYFLGAVPVVLTIVLATNHQVSHDVVPRLHLGSRMQDWVSPGFVTFSSLLHAEYLHWFGRGRYGYTGLLGHAAGSVLLPVFFIFQILSFCFGPPYYSALTRRAVLFAFFIPFLLSSPLFLIGRDWGRFFAYAFILTLVSLSQWRRQHHIEPSRARQTALGASLLLAGITTSPLLANYRVGGLSYSPKVFFVSLPILAVATFVTNRARTIAEKLGKSPAP